jgi:hypothetical protein
VTILLAILASAVLALMGLKLVRFLRERRAASAGFITFGGDDRYQARNVQRDVHDAVMVARVQLDMTEDAFEAVVARIQQHYVGWFEQLQAAIEHRPGGAAFAAPLEIHPTRQPFALAEAPLLSKIVVYRQEQVILLVGNHVYLGGYLLSQFVQLVFCGSVSRNVFPRNPYLPVATELMMLAFLGRHLLMRARHRPPLFPDRSHIQRFYLRRDLAGIQAEANALKLNYLYVVIALHVQMVMQRMNRNWLRVTLPASFADEATFNTVGAIILDIEATPDLAGMARQVRKLVKRSQWQVSATNHIQRIFPTRKLSQRARNVVDLTLTVVPQKTLPDNLLTKEMKSYEFTMGNIQYPVYAMAFIFEDHVHTSFMVNTPAFDVGAFTAADGATPLDLALPRASAFAG